MSLGEKPLVDSDYWVMTPEVEIRPILVPIFSVNQSAPSGPAVIAKGWLLAVGTAYSVKVGVCPSSVKIEEAAAKPRMTAEALIAPARFVSNILTSHISFRIARSYFKNHHLERK
jgi:hypothetical protein